MRAEHESWYNGLGSVLSLPLVRMLFWRAASVLLAMPFTLKEERKIVVWPRQLVCFNALLATRKRIPGNNKCSEYVEVAPENMLPGLGASTGGSTRRWTSVSTGFRSIVVHPYFGVKHNTSRIR